MKNRRILPWRWLAFWLSVFALPLTSVGVEAQLPEFMNRLGGGRVAQSGFKEVIDFTYVSGWICIKARLNDEEQDRRFILDTYSVCLLREGLQSIPGLDVLDATKDLGGKFEGTPMRPLFPKFRKVRIGRVVFEDIGAMVLSESSGSAVASMLEDGLIGANLMRHCLWQVDFEHRKITLADRIEALEGLENAVRIPFRPKPLQYSPDVEVILDGGEKASLQFDTGATGFISLLTPSLKSLVDSGKAVAWTAHLDRFIEEPGATGIETHYFVRVPSLELGSCVFENLAVAVLNPSKSELMNRGNLGLEFMKNFIVTFDWTSNTIWLAPIAGKEPKRNIRTVGFTYGYRDGAMRISSIYAGSPAEKAGLRIDTPILSINGKPVDRLTGDEVRRFKNGDLAFSTAEDKEITLELLIEGKKVSMSFASYELFTDN
ncbi:MAG: aspartyl protease family protein [Candidatus Aminicenantes bacterium]|nr:aspartyl protease family protein [Candidatus Aminicenantes bacterium]